MAATVNNMNRSTSLLMHSILIALLTILACIPAYSVTRLYLPSTGAAVVSPPFTHNSTWNEVDGADRIATSTTKITSAMTGKSQGKAVTANVRQLMRQYVSAPLSGAQSVSGTVKGTIRVIESAGNDNIDKVSLKLIVVSGDGQSLTGTCLTIGDYGPTTEWSATAFTARRIADGDSITTVSANDGDRIVIEIGYNNTTTGTSITGDMSFGDDSGTDLGDNETDTAANNPFLELSATLTFGSEAVQPRRRTIFIGLLEFFRLDSLLAWMN